LRGARGIADGSGDGAGGREHTAADPPRTAVAVSLRWLLVLAATAVMAVPRALSCQSPDPAVQLYGAFVGDLTRTVRGGTARATEALFDVDLQLQVNGPVLGWPGGYAFLYVLGDGGGDPSQDVGDFQGVDNIAAPSTWKIFEAWVEQHFLDERASALLGLYDLNSEFDVVGSSQLFLNSSFGIGPDLSQSGLNGPSIFPTTSLALRLKAVPRPRWRVEAAVLDGVPGEPGHPDGTHVDLARADGLLVSGEIAYFEPVAGGSADAEERERPFHTGGVGRERQPAYDAKVAVGTWTYTSRLDPSWVASAGRSWGAYLLAESRVVRDGADGRGLWLFGRTGLASDAVNQVGRYVGGGLNWRGLGRDGADEVGIGVAAARNGARYMEARRAERISTDGWEVAVELSSFLDVADWLAVQPDVQWIAHPGMDPGVHGALFLCLRTLLTLP